jgi:TetR/AcrR family transcriptional regulator, transcriptional repressor of bet genes
MVRPKIDHDERRILIATAACEVILEVGLENSKLSDIATRAGVTTGAVQHYFKSKEELLFFAKNHVFDIMMEKSGDPPAELTGAERLFFIIRQHLPLGTAHIKAVRLLEAFRGRAVGNPTLLRNQHRRDRKFLGMLEKELALAQQQGVIRADIEVPVAAMGLNAMIEGLGCIIMPSPGAFKDVDIFAIVIDYVCAVFGTPRPVHPLVVGKAGRK